MSPIVGVAPQINYYQGNAKVKYYYKLTEKADLDAFSNSIFQGSYQLQQIEYFTASNTEKIINLWCYSHNRAHSITSS